MDVNCPHCNQLLTLKISKPGRFAPQCPTCHHKLLITVPSDPSQTITVEIPQTDVVTRGELPKEPAPSPPSLPPQAEATQEVASEVPPALTQPPEAAAATQPGPSAAEATQVMPDSSAEEASSSEEAVEEPEEPSNSVELPEVTPEPSGAAEATQVIPESSDATEATQAIPEPSRATEATQAIPEAGVVAEGTAEWTSPASAEADAQTQTAAAPAGAEGTSPAAETDVPATLGGYRILKRLGQGAMGAVYLAKQLSLNRNVALKTIRPEVAKNPVAVARFTREAYAAAQLVHHNVVQIYDLAADHGVNFFSMEFVNGQNLADLVRQKKKLSAQEATGLILQAARGLRFAHQNGMVHRDVKPANLMLNDQGIVKVADLGLVKVSAEAPEPSDEGAEAPQNAVDTGALSSEVTLARTTMGTAAYIAPEQVTDAHDVDHRADIYSLGCTYFVLLTGRAPFEGKNVLEIIRRHQREQVPRPDEVDAHVPRQLGDIVAKMTAKKPDDRYADLDEAITSMEEFLARGEEGTLEPRPEHVRDLKACLGAFNGSSFRTIRRLAVPLFSAMCALLFVWMLVTGHWVAACWFVAYGAATFVSNVVFRGVYEEEHLFTRLRALALESSWTDRLIVGVGVFFVVVVMLMLHLFVLVFAIALGIGTAAAFYFTIDRSIASARSVPMGRVRQVIQALRTQGLEEHEVHKIVMDNCGRDWEEPFEYLFGYEAKMGMRRQRAESGQKTRRQYAAWRDSIIRWADQRLQQQRNNRERRLLQGVEQKRLESEGISQVEARKRASAAAETLVTQAAQLQELMATAAPGDRNLAKKRQEMFRSLVWAAQTGNATPPKRSVLAPLGGMANVLFGPGLRFLLGIVLLVLCAIWFQKNGLLPTSVEDVKQQVGMEDLSDTQAWIDRYTPAFGAAANEAVSLKTTEKLIVPGIPERFSGKLTGITLGVGALILLLGSFLGARWAGPLVLIAVLVTLFGNALGIPVLVSLNGYDLTSAGIGAGLLMVGAIAAGRRG